METMHNTRRYFVPFPSHSTAKLERSAFYMSCKIVNKVLKSNIGKPSTGISFLKRVKQTLLNKAYYSLNEFFNDTL